MEAEAEAIRFAERLALRDRPDAERSGETLVNLKVVRQAPGLGNNQLIRLVKHRHEQALPWNRFKVGSPVLFSSQTGSRISCHGVVSERRRDSIEVSLTELPEGTRYRIDLATDEITRKRQQAALQRLSTARGRIGELRRVLLGERSPRFDAPVECEFQSKLNPSQQQAVEFALGAEDVAIIHGPPGTGKTTTVVELIVQAVQREHRVLASAPSNTAVDNLVERLAAAGRRVVRLGHPARVDKRLRDHTLDQQVEEHELQEVISDLRREADELFRRSERWTRAKPKRGARGQDRRDAQRCLAEIRHLERVIIRDVLDDADVICTTTTFNDEWLGDREFDLVVIDEACQSTEPGCWVPVLRTDRLVLAGDHRQLPPTVLSAQAAQEGFQVSLLERLIELHGPSISRALDVQYRMHTDIMRFSSQQFYDDRLQAHDSVAGHRLEELLEFPTATWMTRPVTFVDSAGAGWEEQQEEEGLSRWNPQEATFLLEKLRELREAGLPGEDIAVIAPYAAQVRWLRDHVDWPELEVDTVDGFQGREKEVVLISCVRSNLEGEIGFLADTRRMNVALTRARRGLLVLGDSATLAHHPFFAALIDYIENLGGYTSVWQE